MTANIILPRILAIRERLQYTNVYCIQYHGRDKWITAIICSESN